MEEVVDVSEDGVLRRLESAVGGRLIRSTDMFTVAIKPFMDRYTYDQDRIANCCHHTTDTKGKLVSFCEYNTIGRGHDSWNRFPRRAELV